MPFTWPPAIQDCPVIGWSDSKQPNTVRTETSTGPAKVRRRFTKANRQLSMRMEMTSEEIDVVENFFHSTLADGVERFDFPHPRTGATHSVRFLSPISYSETARNMYLLTINLEYSDP